MLKPIKKILDKLQNAIKGEIELVKLKALKTFSYIMGDLFSVTFLLIFMNTTIVLCGLWLGFYLSELLGSNALGFGIAAGGFILLFLIFLIFRKALLLRPAQSMIIRYYNSVSDLAEESTLPQTQDSPDEKPS